MRAGGPTEAQAHGSPEGQDRAEKTARVSSAGADTRKGGIRKAGWDHRGETQDCL